MKQYIHMARVPEGEERDYIRGVLAYASPHVGKTIFFVTGYIIIAGGMFYAAFFGKQMLAQDEKIKIFGFLFCMALGVFFLTVGFRLLMFTYKQKRREDNLNYIKVCDVELIDVIVAWGITYSYFTKIKFEDGSVSSIQCEAMLYAMCAYETGLLVYVLDQFGEFIKVKVIPKFERDTKAYKLSMRGLQKLEG